MSDAYSTDETEAPGTAEEADAASGGDKLSQQEANYRRGNPVKHCGICQYFEGGDQCSQVESPISPYGISDVYRSVKNPFGQMIGPQERQMIMGMMNSGPDQSEALQASVPQPQVRIGNRTY